MAIIKCKECGKEISSTAKKCTNCGFENKRSRPLIALIFLGAMVALAVSSVNNEKDVSQKVEQTESIVPKEKQKSIPGKPAAVNLSKWRTLNSSDEMTGEASYFATSDSVKPNRRMGFPYSNVIADLFVGCDKNDKWVYVAFNERPILSHGKTKSGYDLIDARIKFNDSVEVHTFTQEWGSRFIYFSSAESIIKKLKKSNVLSLEFDWHGEQAVIFKFDLTGSSKAIDEISNDCRMLSK